MFCFISHRQEDSKWAAIWLFDSLSSEFGPRSVFLDKGSLRAGHQWKAELVSALKRAEVMIALIGGEWLTMTDAKGQRKLDNPKDIVCYELKTALARNIPIIPLLVNNATCPHRADVPAEISPLFDWQAMHLRDNRAKEDLQELLVYLRNGLPLPQPDKGEGLEELAGVLALPPPLTLETVARVVEPSLSAAIWSRLREGEKGFVQPSVFGARGTVLSLDLARRANSDANLRHRIEQFLDAVEAAARIQQTGRSAIPLHETYAGRAYILLAHALRRV